MSSSISCSNRSTSSGDNLRTIGAAMLNARLSILERRLLSGSSCTCYIDSRPATTSSFCSENCLGGVEPEARGCAGASLCHSAAVGRAHGPKNTLMDMGGSVFRSEATASTGAISVGLTYSQTNRFGNGQSSTFFNILAVFETDNSSLASPTGFEPVLPP
jgi:hypothetical protein